MKWIFKTALVLITLVVILATIIWFQPVSPIQKNRGYKNIYLFPDSLIKESLNQDSLIRLVGPNKGLPPGFELAALVAYSAYPELRDVNIDMILTQTGAPMEANMNMWSLFGPKSERQYMIYLSDEYESALDPILLRSLPFDAQVGILAHELGHVVYYHDLSTLELAKWGSMYLISSEFRAMHEKTTDLMPVYYGLGHQIHRYAHYIRHDPSCKPLYQLYANDFIDKYYLTDVEILNELKSHPLYSDSNL